MSDHIMDKTNWKYNSSGQVFNIVLCQKFQYFFFLYILSLYVLCWSSVKISSNVFKSVHFPSWWYPCNFLICFTDYVITWILSVDLYNLKIFCISNLLWTGNLIICNITRYLKSFGLWKIYVVDFEKQKIRRR